MNLLANFSEQVCDFTDNWLPRDIRCGATVIVRDDDGYLCGRLVRRRCNKCKESYCDDHLETVAFEPYCYWCAIQERAEIEAMVKASRMVARA